MSARTEAAAPCAAPLTRTRHPTPWSRAAVTRPDRPGTQSAVPRARPAPPPVFVDDSGRRRRLGRLLGTGLAVLVLCYVAVVGLTFSGAPLVGRLSPPGVDRLSRPAGDDGVDVGPGSRESPLPPAAASPAAPPSDDAEPAAEGADSPAPVERQTPSPTTTAPASTTTITTSPGPGQGATTSVPTPSSTVPEHTHPTGGPPTEPPGKP
jgi:hypothetical protein